jgi:hypothetical protein
VASQSTLLTTLSPSAEQVTSFFPGASHSRCPAVHTQFVHCGVPPAALQVCRAAQLLGTQRSPIAVQRTIALALQKALSATQTSITHSPAAQWY